MIKINEKLTILYDRNGVYTDVSDKLLSFQRDTFETTMIGGG